MEIPRFSKGYVSWTEKLVRDTGVTDDSKSRLVSIRHIEELISLRSYVLIEIYCCWCYSTPLKECESVNFIHGNYWVGKLSIVCNTTISKFFSSIRTLKYYGDKLIQHFCLFVQLWATVCKGTIKISTRERFVSIIWIFEHRYIVVKLCGYCMSIFVEITFQYCNN